MNTPYMHDWVFAHAATTPDAPAIATATARLSYQDLAERVRILAERLRAHGICSGERVLVALPNTPATVVVGLAIQLLGATPVELNRGLGPDVLAAVVDRMNVRRLVIAGRDVAKWEGVLTGRAIDRVWVVPSPGSAGVAVETVGRAPIEILTDDGRADALARATSKVTEPLRDADTPAVVLFTSGTTGLPHGVIQTHGNIAANTKSIVSYLGLTAQDRALLTLPLNYCYGRSVLQTHLFVGGSIYMEERLAYPALVLRAIEDEACTGFAGVPLTFEIIRRQIDVRSMSFTSLRYLTQAGGGMAPGTIEWVRAAFQPAELYVMYGQTEATARLTYLPPSRARDKPDSIGVPIPGVIIEIVDGQGRELPPGVVGELVARGDNVTTGYFDEPEATASILHDGWLWTGDVAHRDAEGFIFLHGRSKELLKIGGHRVSPAEIEHVLTLHPEVADVAVIGIADDLMGEAPVAFVVRTSGGIVSEEALRAFGHERLPRYAVPISFEFVDTLPRGESGKLLRAELRASHISK